MMAKCLSHSNKLKFLVVKNHLRNSSFSNCSLLGVNLDPHSILKGPSTQGVWHSTYTNAFAV